MLTNAGLSLLATALQTPGADAGISYVSVGLGAGTLASALVNGTNYTSLSLAAPLVSGIAVGQSLTIIDSFGDTQILSATGNLAGSSTVGVASFLANANYAIGSGVVNTPAQTDSTLQNEQVRLAAIPGVAGATPGESLNAGYFDPTQPSATYLEVGYYGGSTATSAIGTGIMIARDVQFWAHTQNLDSASFQLDSIL